MNMDLQLIKVEYIKRPLKFVPLNIPKVDLLLPPDWIEVALAEAERNYWKLIKENNINPDDYESEITFDGHKITLTLTEKARLK